MGIRTHGPVFCMVHNTPLRRHSAWCQSDCLHPALHPVPCRTSISELSLHRWFIGSTWAMLVVISSLLWLMYNLYPDRGLESWEKRCAAQCSAHVCYFQLGKVFSVGTSYSSRQSVCFVESTVVCTGVVAAMFLPFDVAVLCNTLLCWQALCSQTL
jgi:hypothetical protein